MPGKDCEHVKVEEKSVSLLTSSITDQVQIIEDSYWRTSERLETSCAVACVLTLILKMHLLVTESDIQIFTYKLQCNKFLFSLMCFFSRLTWRFLFASSKLSFGIRDKDRYCVWVFSSSLSHPDWMHFIYHLIEGPLLLHFILCLHVTLHVPYMMNSEWVNMWGQCKHEAHFCLRNSDNRVTQLVLPRGHFSKWQEARGHLINKHL